MSTAAKKSMWKSLALLAAVTCLTLTVVTYAADSAKVVSKEGGHRAAAIRLIEVSGLEDNFNENMTTSVDIQIRANPQLAPYADVMKKWAAESLKWDAVEEDFITLYMKYFTEDELNTLADFQSTPVGKKSIKLQPTLVREGAAIGMKLGQAKSGQLQKMIEARQAELQQGR